MHMGLSLGVKIMTLDPTSIYLNSVLRHVFDTNESCFDVHLNKC